MKTMQIGMIGLGRMGSNRVRRLLKGGHQCVVFDHSKKAVKDLVKEKAVGASSLADFVQTLEQPRAIWMMIPGAFVDQLIAEAWRRGSMIADLQAHLVRLLTPRASK